jgi:hypothetical protein
MLEAIHDVYLLEVVKEVCWDVGRVVDLERLPGEWLDN